MTEDTAAPADNHELVKQIALQSSRIARLEQEVRELQLQINKIVRSSAPLIRR